MKGLILMLTFCAAFAACGGNAVDTNTAANANTSNAAQPASNNNAATTFPQESVDAFMTSCEEAGRDAAFCTCVLEKIQAKYSFEQFAEIESQIQEGEPSKEFVEFSETARAECAKQKDRP